MAQALITFVGVASDVMQFGLDAATGAGIFGAGACKVDADGLTLIGGIQDRNKIKWVNDSGSVTSHINTFAGLDQTTTEIHTYDGSLESGIEIRSYTEQISQSNLVLIANTGGNVPLPSCPQYAEITMVVGTTDPSGYQRGINLTTGGTSITGTIALTAGNYTYKVLGSTPTNPPSGTMSLYPKSDGFYQLTSAGVETKLGGGSDYPTVAFIPAVSMKGNKTLTRYGGADDISPWVYNVSAGADDGDWYMTSFVIAAGTYDMCFAGYQQSINGILDWYIDGTAVVTGQDWYGAGAPSVREAGTIAISAGKHILIGSINGKNALASDYAFQMQSITIYPTGTAGY